MTGFGKSDQNVTQGLFHFVAPANSYTHTLPIHNGITRLNKLLYFSKVGFFDHVKSQLRKWGPWRVLDRRYVIGLSVGVTSLRLSRLSWPIVGASWTHNYTRHP